jgi:hypothetical protein
MARPFELREFAEIMGVTRRRAQSWAEGEFVRPHVLQSPGSRRWFYHSDIMRAAVVMRMQTVFGAKNSLARRAVLAADKLAEEAAPKLELMELPDQSSIALTIYDYGEDEAGGPEAVADAEWYSAEAVAAGMRRGGTAIVIDLSPVLRDVMPRLQHVQTRQERRR